MQLVNAHRCFGGTLQFFRHDADVLGCAMGFSLFLPDQAEKNRVPLVWWLSGLTCTEENFTVKSGAYGEAARLGLSIIAPDTSPRGEDVADDAAYDLGQGAGFYVDATEPPWKTHFSMYSYISQELQALVARSFPIDVARQGICGHSMGGHGALVLGLRNPSLYKSISAFSPIASPSECPWGRKAFSAYLGKDPRTWQHYDGCQILRAGGSRAGFPEILVDQGASDQFLGEQLMPERLVDAARQCGQALRLRMQNGYDHSYFFVATFIGDHLAHHAGLLR